jgi:hypothetical protein
MNAMRTWRTRRLDRPEADRLLAGGTPDPEYLGLGALLDAARAPGTPEELAGERSAVARFVASRHDAVPAGKPGERRRPGRRQSAGMLVVRVAAVVAVLMTGGTVLAAKTDRLPATVQWRAHDLLSPLGIPAPVATGRPSGIGSASAVASRRPAAPTWTGMTPGATDPSHSSPLALCQAWDAARKGPHGGTVPGPLLAALTAAAKGQPSIASFCAHVLSGNGKRDTATDAPSHHEPTVTATPDPGGSGKAHGHAAPTPHR